MKNLLRLMFLGGMIVAADTHAADRYVRSYVKRDGTYVEPHLRSEPDGYKQNNRSDRGW